MTVALITDQHLDGRKGSLAFWEYFQKFYDDVFFPTLERQGITEIIDLGDTFDNRKSIDFNVWGRIRRNYFDRLHDMGITVHMILGNHCVYYKNTNRVNSPELLLTDYENIQVYNGVCTTYIEDTPICLVPWINKENKEETFSHLESTNAEIVMGHLELDGFEVTPGLKMEHGMDPKLFSRFKQVFSGHYHHKSTKGNITYLGNPYQMFWNDYKDTRGFHLYKPAENKIRRVKNPYEIFQKVYYNDVANEKHVIDETYRNTFVKVIVEEKRDYQQFEKVIDDLYNIGAHDVKIVETLVDPEDLEDVNLDIKDTMTLLNEYVDEIDVQVEKSELKKLMRTLYIESCEVA